MTSENLSTDQLRDEFYKREAKAAENWDKQTARRVLKWTDMAYDVMDYLEVPEENHYAVFCALVQSIGTAHMVEQLINLQKKLGEVSDQHL